VIFPLLLSTLIGVTLAALGAGGAMLTVPLLVHLVGVSPRQAVPMSMVIVGATALAAAVGHFRRGNLDIKAAVTFALSGVVGAWAGSFLMHLVSEQTLMLLFAALLLTVGIRMLRSGAIKPNQNPRLLRCLFTGFGIGVLTGFLGVGGGFLLVPGLVLFAGLDTKRAAGTSLAVISANCASGLLAHIRTTPVDWRLTLSFLTATLTGMLLGLAIAKHAPEAALRKAFAALILTVGTAVLIANLR
jgi:uncharacterized membrane protein YfcA